MHIIPLLHTLYYVVIQPYSAVALSTLRSIKMEMTTSAGSLYQRRLVAEQYLNNKHFTLQEKVFMFADPAVFSAPLEATVRARLEVCSLLRDTSTMEKTLMIHVLQAGLGTACQSSRLAQAPEVSKFMKMLEQVRAKYIFSHANSLSTTLGPD
ncbi:phosphoinositide 3-kinase regulatory subunit 6 [Trachinotus anak]|uniref:phosphoinositide 3-kinase regulatory subunit 6 n=1 Tax=Trachinotus anak TaxID=443729 RepID=UPI0039F211F1